MNEPAATVSDSTRLAGHFSALQPVASPVLLAHASVPGCCLETVLRLHVSDEAGRSCSLQLPSAGDRLVHPAPQIMAAEVAAPFLQVLAGGGATQLVLLANGAAECPPGRPHRVLVIGPSGERLARTIPFEAWAIPLGVRFHLAEGAAPPELLHPCRLPQLPPTVWTVSVPNCAALAVRAVVAVFPDVRWHGEVTVRTEPDATAQKGFRIGVESDVTCTHGDDEWRLTAWAEAIALCPWLECLETLGRSVAAFALLKPAPRTEGLGNPRLRQRGPLTWTWPKARVHVESSLHEQGGTVLLGHRLVLEGAGQPLLEAAGEQSLLETWLENPLWWERLAPLRVGLSGADFSALLPELGLWLVVEGRLNWQVRREEDRPAAPSRVVAEARGRIAVEIEGRSARDDEALLVRAGSAGELDRPAGFSIAAQAPPLSPHAEAVPEPCLGRVAFSGLVLHSVEKLRPGIRIRRWEGGAPAPPLASLLLPRVWPAVAVTQPAPIPWFPA